ncbi:hypothetical protein BDF21DRAFT_454727 [Thamnidium elegans]|nr:hypothetical protein BDF21DRAFT_454727 [Thamnidium elegans]
MQENFYINKMRTTAFITLAIASCVLFSSTEAASLAERRVPILNGVPGDSHKLSPGLTHGLHGSKRALENRGVGLTVPDLASAPVKRGSNGGNNGENNKFSSADGIDISIY